MNKIVKPIMNTSMFILVFLAIVFPFYKIMRNSEQIFLDKTGSYDNLYEMPDIIMNTWVEYLVKSFVENDVNYIENHKNYFTEDAYEKVINSIENVHPIGIKTYVDEEYNGEIRNLVVEKCYRHNVLSIFCNFIIEHPDTSFSGVYLIDLHLDYSGIIYGYNIWQY